ncbi:MAG: cupin domain-containing protein [Candidatus Binatia bacterium]
MGVRFATKLPATRYKQHRAIFGTAREEAPAGLLFDSQNFAVMSISHPPDSETPDLNTDKDGDRVLILLEGDLALQIGDSRVRLGTGDAVQIPRGTRFGRACSQAGAQLLLIRGKPLRSFSILR